MPQMKVWRRLKQIILIFMIMTWVASIIEGQNYEKYREREMARIELKKHYFI